MNKETVTREYNNYSDSYNALFNILTNVIANKEIKQDDVYDLEETHASYVNNAEIIRTALNQEDENIATDKLEKSKVITKETILDLLTEGGTRNIFYQGNDGEILIDGQGVPALVLLAKKLNLIATDGEDESSITLTPTFIQLLAASDILLGANNIKLEGYTTINGGFKIDENGNMEANDGKFKGNIEATSGKISSDLEVDGLNVSGTLTADALNVRQLNYFNDGITSDISLTVDTSITDTPNIFENNGKFNSLQRAIESIPKNLNGYTVSIAVNSILYENITIKGFNGGTLYVLFNKNNYGNILGHNCGAEILLQGTGTTTQVLVSNYKTTGNVNMRTGGDTSYNIVQTVPSGAVLLLTDFNSNGWGYTTYNGKSGWMSTNTSYMVKEEVYQTSGTSTAIQPNELITQDGYNFAAVFRNCPYVAIYNLELYSKTGDANNYTVGSIRGSYLDIENSKLCGSENGILANRGGRVFESNVTGKVNSIAQKVELSGTIYINDGTTVNGTISKDNSSQIIYSESGAVKDNTSNVGTNTNTTTATSAVTIYSNSGNTYRHNIYTGYKNDNTVRQGDYGFGDCDGIWLFGSQFANKLKGKKITKISLTVSRLKSGIYGNVTGILKMHNHTIQPSTAPVFTSGWSKEFVMIINTSMTIEITDATVLNAIKNGTCAGFGVQADYDKAHYATYEGTCTLVATIQG